MVTAEILESIRGAIGEIDMAEGAREMAGHLDRIVANPDDYEANARLGLLPSRLRNSPPIRAIPDVSSERI